VLARPEDEKYLTVTEYWFKVTGGMRIGCGILEDGRLWWMEAIKDGKIVKPLRMGWAEAQDKRDSSATTPASGEASEDAEG
jgi:hypothetical protein